MGISEFEDEYEAEDAHKITGAILTEPIRVLEPKAPVCVRPGTTLRQAIDAMNAVKACCLLVTEGDRLLGILTERDILREVVGKMDLEERVEQAMTPDPETVTLDEGIAFALSKMHVGGFRHIPVVDERKRPVGVVSVRDFVRFIVALFPSAVLNLPPEPALGVSRTPGGG